MPTRQVAGRPPIVVVLAGLVALNGIASLVDAITLGAYGRVGTAAAVLQGIIGLLLLWRAYALWTFRRGVYFVTIILLSGKTILAILNITIRPTSAEAWVGFALVIAVLLLLARRDVRDLFLHPHTA